MIQQGRKQDVRRKIELGGLVIKAGIDDVDKPALLGAMLLAAELLQTGEGLAQARKKGEQAFAAGATSPAGGRDA